MRGGREAVVGCFVKGCARGVWFCAAAWLWLIPALPLCADDGPFDLDGNATSFSSDVASEQESSVDTPLFAPAWRGDFSTRSQFTGDWSGARDNLAGSGVTFFGDITQYYQGVTAGGLARQFEYGGRGDYLVDFDSQKLGLWEGGHLDLRGETRLGQDTNRIDGALAPSNFAMALPLPNQNVTALTGVQYTQDLSDNLSVFAGKLNILDGTPQSYAIGRRLDYFFNVAMQSNLARVYLFPSVLGTGFTVRDDVEPIFNFYLLDTHYTPTTSGFSTLFSNGVLLFGEYRQRTNWFNLPGHSAAGFLYSNATRTSLDTNPYILLPGLIAGTPLPSQETAWTVTYRFDQVVYMDAEASQRRWTVYGDYGLTDGNPNSIHWFANVALVGTSPIRNRDKDTFGLGYYHLGVSHLPILETLGLGAENGVELFYNIEVTPWFHFTPDLQVLDPAQSHNATALLFGIRGRMSF